MCDQLGTSIQGYNEEGSLIWHRELDSYGNARMEKGDAGFCPYLYQGQTLDSETGLAYNRFRYYDPEQGSYISQDPIGLRGGFELYKYLHDPTGWIDPFGMSNIATGSGRTHVKYTGIRNGKPYHGYASAPSDLDLTPDEIISRRYGSNFDVAPEFDYVGKDEIGKQTARGLEQRGFEADGGLSGTANAQNPVGSNNKNRQMYLDAADNHNRNKTKATCP